MDSNKIVRGILVGVLGVLAVFGGTYLRQVVVDHGQFVIPTKEAIIAGVTGVVIGYFAPSAEDRKKNRENVAKRFKGDK